MQLMMRKADMADFEKILEFLGRAGLATEDLTEESAGMFLLAEDGEGIRGCLGIEQYGRCGLLRSLAISVGMNEHDLLLMFEQMILLAKERNMEHLFLATNKRNAIPFFEMVGFKSVVKSELPPEFFSSSHVLNILNVDNSVFLKFSL